MVKFFGESKPFWGVMLLDNNQAGNVNYAPLTVCHHVFCSLHSGLVVVERKQSVNTDLTCNLPSPWFHTIMIM